jgi:beta-lactamase class A
MARDAIILARKAGEAPRRQSPRILFVTLNRRALLVAASGLAVWPALAQETSKEPSQEPADKTLPALTTYEHETGGRIGLYAKNLVTGVRIAWRAQERFVMCSTFKASLAALVLTRVDRGEDHLEQMVAYGPQDLLEYAPTARQNLAMGAMSVAEMCEAAVELSDNTCANLLLARVGGPSALTAFWRSTGDSVTRLEHHEPELNRSPPGDPNDTTTPAAMAGNLQRFTLGEVLSQPSRQRLTNWMLNCKTGNNRLRAGLPKDWRVGDKTGNNGKDASGDISVAWPRPDRPVLIAAYTQGGSPNAAQLEAVFTEIGRMVARQLG